MSSELNEQEELDITNYEELTYHKTSLVQRLLDISDYDVQCEKFIDERFEHHFIITDKDLNPACVPVVEMEDPDGVNALSRSDVLTVLDSVRKITEARDKVIDILQKVDDETERCKNTAREIMKTWPLWAYIIVFVLAVVSIVWSIAVKSFLAFLFLGGLTALISKYLISKLVKIFDIDRKKNEIEALFYNTLPQLGVSFSDAMADLKSLNMSEQMKWGAEVVGEDMLDTEAIDILIGYIKSRRADNIKEAVNKFDLDGHHQRMEIMQQEIDEATQIQAEEAVKQTAYAEQTAKNARATAVASSITAYNSWKTSKYAKKSYKTIKS